MAKGYTSPGISYTESSVDSITNSINTTSVGIIGFAIKGGFAPVEVKTVQELHDNFGTSYIGEINGKKMYSKAIIAAERILKNTNSVVFCRLPIDDTEKLKFSVAEDEVEFTVGTYDASVASIKLTQTMADGETDYKYTVSEIHKDGTERVLVKNIYEEDLEDFVKEEGTLTGFKVISLPIAPPAPITTQTITTEEGEAVVTDTTPIYFDSYRVSERLSETATFTWSATDETYVAETESITFKVNQPAEVTSKTFNVVEEAGDYVAHCDGFDIGIILGDAFEQKNWNSTHCTDADPYSTFDFSSLDVTVRPAKTNLHQTVSDNYTYAYYTTYSNCGDTSNPIKFKIVNAPELVEITQEDKDNHVIKTVSGFRVDCDKLKNDILVPAHICVKGNGASSDAYFCVVRTFQDESHSQAWSSSNFLSGDAFITWADGSLGSGLLSFATTEKTGLRPNSVPHVTSVDYILEGASTSIGDYFKSYPSGTLTYTVKANFDYNGTTTVVDQVTGLTSISAIVDWLQNHWWMEFGSGYGVQANPGFTSPLGNVTNQLDTAVMARISSGSVDPTKYIFELNVPADGSPFVFPTSEVSKENFITTLGDIYYPTRNLHINIARKAGVSDANFPIPSSENTYEYFRVVKESNGLYQVWCKDIYNDEYEMLYGEDYMENDPTPVARGSLYDALEEAIDWDYNDLEILNTIPLTEENKRLYPIGQSPYNVHTSIKVTKKSNGKYDALLDGTTLVAENATSGTTLLSAINGGTILTANKNTGIDDRDFPIEQPREVNVNSITITSAGTDSYNVTININGANYNLVSGATSATIISALASATVTLEHTGTIVPLINVEQLITGRNFPIYQGEIKSSVTYPINAEALAGITNISDTKLSEVFSLFKSAEDRDIDIFVAPFADTIEEKINASSESSTTKKRKIKENYSRINNNIIDVVDSRNDCMSVLDYPLSFTYDDALAFLKSEDYDCANACICYPSVTYKDTYEGVNVELPASAILSDKLVYTDSIDACWYAPAGIQNNRGVISDGKVTEVIDEEQREELYNNRINPIKNVLGVGAVNWGELTLKKSSRGEESVFSTIGVRRLANLIKKVVTAKSYEILFAPNDSTSWDAWKNSIRPVLREIQNNHGIEEFKIVMDRTTITDEGLAAGRAPGVIYVKPISSIRFIPISFVMTESGIEFD